MYRREESDFHLPSNWISSSLSQLFGLESQPHGKKVVLNSDRVHQVIVTLPEVE